MQPICSALELKRRLEDERDDNAAPTSLDSCFLEIRRARLGRGVPA
jgi:hypothetical protein